MPQQFPNENRLSRFTRVRSSPIGGIVKALEGVDKNGLFALLDQCLVSAMSLIASVVVGRVCGADGLGIYSLAITIVVLSVVLHTALVSTPYTVFRTRIKQNEEKHFAGSSLVSSMVVMAIGVGLLLIVYPAFYYFQFLPGFEYVILTVAFLLPFLLLREFARRYAFAHLNMLGAVIIDGMVAAIQLVSLVVLAMLGLLTPITALVCLGVSCAAVAIAWLVQRRSELVVDRRYLTKNLTRKWSLGRWVLLDHILTIFSAQITPWLLIFLIDSTATGILAACLVVVNLSSPFLQGMGNSLSPKFAKAAMADTTAPIQRLFWRSTLFMTGTMALFVLMCFFAGEFMLQILYEAPEYRGRGLIVTLLAIRAMVGSAYISANHALLAIEKPLASLYCSLAGLIATVVLGLLLIPVYGILGGAIAMLIGTGIEVITIFCGYIFVLGHYRQERVRNVQTANK